MANGRIDENGLPVYAPGDYDFVRVVDRSTGASRNALAPEVTAAARAVSGALDQIVADALADIAPVIAGLGYLPPVPFAPGLTVDSSRFTVSHGGEVYAPVADALPFTTTETFDPDQWRLIQGVTSSDLAADTGARMVGFRQLGSGATHRVLEEKVREWVSVDDYKDSSDADDSAALQKAINALPATGGVVRGIPNRVYKVQGVELRSGVFLDFRGCDVTPPPGATQTMFSARGTGSDTLESGGIVGGTFDGIDRSIDWLDTSANDRTLFFVVQDVTVRRFNYGYKGSDNERRSTFLNCRFWNNNFGMSFGEHAIVRSCDIRDNDVGITGRLNDVKIVGCDINYNRVGVEPAPGGTISNTRFFACAFFKNTEAGARLGWSCLMQGCGLVGVGDGDVGVELSGHGNKIEGNVFGQGVGSTFGDSAIKFVGTGSGTDKTQVLNNRFNVSNGEAAISGSAERTNTHDLSVCFNVFQPLGTSHEITAMRFPYTNLQRIQFIGNQITLYGGIGVDASAADGGMFLANRIEALQKDAGGLFRFSTSTPSIPRVFSSNMIRTASGGSGTFIAGDARGVRVQGNVNLGSVTWDGSATVNSATIVSNNHGLSGMGSGAELTGASSFAPGTVAAGAGVQTTVSVPGAALGDAVIVGHTANTNGLTVTAWVSSAGVVTVQYQNSTANPISVISGSARVRVIKY